ncbi:MAG: acyl-CoA dehydrogenase family protein [Alphaproteobacteria bacterium]|nr:acyl-CoA dehydrogenase family protein [Alphaproteobacteria bacterium]
MLLNEEQTMIRDMARQFAAEQLAPNAAVWDREATFPDQAVKAMGALGLMGVQVPEGWGGAGLGNTELALVTEEIAAGDGGCSTIMAVQNSVVCMPLYKFGSEEQKQRYLKQLATGEMLGAFMLTEPHTGSDAGAIKTRAQKVGNKYVLNGAKQFISTGSKAGIAITFAVTEPADGPKGISAFIVPTDTPGYTVARVEHKLGQRSSETCAITLDNVEVTPDLLLGEEGEGYRIALSNLESGRIGVAAQAVGMARAAFEHALAYARERETFGKKIIEHQAIAFKLAEMKTNISVARQMYLHAAELRDGGEKCLEEAAMAKLFASEMAETVCSDAIQIHGGYGYLQDFPVERIYRDVRVTQIYEGTSEIQKLVIARELAGAD